MVSSWLSVFIRGVVLEEALDRTNATSLSSSGFSSSVSFASTRDSAQGEFESPVRARLVMGWILTASVCDLPSPALDFYESNPGPSECYLIKAIRDEITELFSLQNSRVLG